MLTALDALRDIHTSGRRDLPARSPVAFLSPQWRKLLSDMGVPDRRAYEVAVMVHLRDRLRSGDIWVEGSRSFRAFDDFLLPPAVFTTRQQERNLGLAVPDSFEAWRQERVVTLESRLQEGDALAAEGSLPEAVITEEGLSMSPIRRDETAEIDDTARPAVLHAAAPAHHRTVCRGP